MGKGGYTGGSSIIKGALPTILDRARIAMREKFKHAADENEWLAERGLQIKRKPPRNGPRKK